MYCTYPYTPILHSELTVSGMDTQFVQNMNAYGDFSPFSSKVEALIYFMMYSPRPIVRHALLI